MYDVIRNKLRAAHVWMDEYASLVELASSSLPLELPLGPLEKRLHLRKKLQCRPFEWFLDNVATEVAAPKRKPGTQVGTMQTLERYACIDALEEPKLGKEVI